MPVCVNVPMRRAIQTDTLCSQCSLKLNYRPHRLSIQVESFMTKSHSEGTGFNHLKHTHTQYGVFTHITHAPQQKKSVWQVYARHNHSPKQIFSADFYIQYNEIFSLKGTWANFSVFIHLLLYLKDVPDWCSFTWFYTFPQCPSKHKSTTCSGLTYTS